MNLRSFLSVSMLKDATVMGRYSPVKCYYNLVDNGNVLLGYKQIWCPLALPKHRFIFWLATQKRLLTGDNLDKYIQCLDLLCPVCGLESENHPRLFF